MHLERWHPDNVPRCSAYLKYTEGPRERKERKEKEEIERGGGGGKGIGGNMVQVRNHVSCFLKLHVLPHNVDTVLL